ncbi:MAG TPA: L,D-transpeptidase family protein [Solirubrobacteraceae bacterium]|jgi:lipoprotein-anchoring transpeptidase ErfK/SrfK|nr:L,D-transpeptidase family protein [Solirubrobacteraceae bacterium]
MPAGRRRVALAVAVAAITATAVVLALPAGEQQRSLVAHQAARALPAPLAPAFTPGPPHRLGPARNRSLWAPVKRAGAVRSAPDAAAPRIAELGTRTPEGTRNIVAVAARGHDRQGRRWVQVRLAVLPNGRTGWVPRAALGGYGTVHTRLIIDLQALSATLYRRGRAVLRAPVAVGATATPTPAGEFYVRNRLTRYRSPAYGPIAFGTSARSPQATDWPAGGFVGIHGTDQPDLVPGRVSHGCIRMRNDDILALARRMPVGTPVVIR